MAGRNDVEDAVTAIATPASAAGLVSLAVFAWAATGMMGAIRQGLESAMGVTHSRPMARGKAVDLVLVVGTAALVLVTAGITVLGQLVHTAGGGVASAADIGAGTLSDGLVRLAAFGLSIVVVLLLYRFVPARGLRIRDGLAGAIVTAIFFQLIALASGFLYERATRLSVVYGSLTAALVFLYSIYLYSSRPAAWRRGRSGLGTAAGRPRGTAADPAQARVPRPFRPAANARPAEGQAAATRLGSADAPPRSTRRRDRPRRASP